MQAFKKVLIVEDDIHLNTAITEFFNLKTFKCVSVTDGLMAMQLIENRL